MGDNNYFFKMHMVQGDREGIPWYKNIQGIYTRYSITLLSVSYGTQAYIFLLFPKHAEMTIK